jgi:hypothetical protein
MLSNWKRTKWVLVSVKYKKMYIKLIGYYFCNENQLDALLILNLFRQPTSTCFGHTYCLSSGGIHCICTAVCTCVLYAYVDWQLLVNITTYTYNTYQLLYIQSEYLLMMGNKYSRNM